MPLVAGSEEVGEGFGFGFAGFGAFALVLDWFWIGFGGFGLVLVEILRYLTCFLVLIFCVLFVGCLGFHWVVLS